MPEEKGIKETLEVADAAEAVALKIVDLGKDGYQIKDGFDLLTDSELRGKVVAGVQGVSEIKEEMADLDEDEVAELAARGVKLIFRIRKAVAAKQE